MKKIILPNSLKCSAKNSIVISSKLSLTRNIDGMLFPANLLPQEKSSIETELLNILQQLPLTHSTYSTYHISQLSTNALMQLSSDLMISPQIFSKIQVLIAKNDGAWILVPNLQDHIYVYSLGYGLCLKEIYKSIAPIFDELDSHIHFAYSSKFGFTTANINNHGNGLNCSVLLNLYASELKGNITQVIQTCQETGYSLTPYTSQPNSGLFLLKNIGSFGISDSEHLSHLYELILQLQQNELNTRELVLNDDENRELLFSQINQTLTEDEISYEEISYIIGLVDFLDRKVYKINDRKLWLEQLFLMKDCSDKFIGLSIDETKQYRMALLKSLFAQIVTLKKG